METEKRGKSKVKIALIILAVIVVIVLTVLQTLTFVLYNENFHQRFSSADMDMMMKTEDFVNLKREKSTFTSDEGQTLTGYFYSSAAREKYKAVVLFSHGYGGGGHSSYRSEIDYLAQNGFLVYAFDNTGNDESEGESVKGLPQGVIDLRFALDHVRTQAVSRDLPIMLCGHSWGGYSVCSELEKETDITAVVSLANFNKSSDMMIDQGVKMYGDSVGMMSPFLTVCDFVNFGSDAFLSSMKGLQNTNAEVLLFHSEDDGMINIENAFDLYESKLGDKENLTFVRLQGKGHSPQAAYEAIEYNTQKKKERRQILSENNDTWTDELQADYMKNYDIEQANALDMDVMEQIVDFYDNSLK